MRGTVTIAAICGLTLSSAANAGPLQLEFVPVQSTQLQLRKAIPAPTTANAPALGVYGHGYDSITGTVLPTVCIAFKSLQPVAGPLPAQGANDVFSQASSLSTVRQNSQISGQASLFYAGFSASVGGGVVNGSFYNSYDRYATAYSRITANQFQLVGQGPSGQLVPTKAATDAYAADLKAKDPSFATFRSVCGDHFVAGYELGGVFNAVIAVRTNQNSSYKQNDIDVGAGFGGIFGAKFSSSDKHSTFTAASLIDTRDMSLGYTVPAVDVDTLYADFHGYAAAARAKPGFIGFLYTAYSTLPGGSLSQVPKFDDLFAADLEILAEKKDAATTLQNDLNDANTAIALGQTYFAVASPAVGQKTAQEEIDDYKLQVAEAGDACRVAKTAQDCKAAVQKVGSPPTSRVKRTMPAS